MELEQFFGAWVNVWSEDALAMTHKKLSNMKQTSEQAGAVASQRKHLKY